MGGGLLGGRARSHCNIYTQQKIPFHEKEREREGEREMYRRIQTQKQVARENVVEYNTARQLTAFQCGCPDQTTNQPVK